MNIVLNPIRPALCREAGDFHVLARMQSVPDSGVRRCGQGIYACGQVVFLSVIEFEGKKITMAGSLPDLLQHQ